MCRGSGARFGMMERNGCSCSCVCPATMTVEEEIQLLEEHKKYMQEQAGIIDKKIAALKAAKGS